MKIKLLYFAQVSEKLGISSEEISFDGSDSNELLSYLNEKYPDLKELKFKIAVDQTLINTTTALKDGVEVALLPPFAGG
jgi:molybdopterin synthase sulfur carrier subunit